MEPPRVTILTALTTEAQAVRQALARRDLAVEVLTIGPAAKRLPPAELAKRPGWIMLAGLGGGLNPDLRCGEVVVEGAPAGWPLPAGIRRGRIATAGAVVSSPADKRAMFDATGADMVDMEQGVVRDWIGPGIAGRLIGVRAVMDEAAEVLPAWTLGLIDDEGRPRATAVAVALAKGGVGVLMRLGRQSKAANRAMAEVAADLAGWILSQSNVG